MDASSTTFPLIDYVREHISEVVLFLIVLYILLFKLIYPKYKIWKKLPPGPWGLPIVGYLPFLGNEPEKTFITLRKKYGDIIGIRYGSEYTIVLNEFNAMKDILNHPSVLDVKQIFGSLPLGIAEMNGEEWVEQRKFTVQLIRNIGFGKKIQETFTQDYVHELVETIKGFNGKPFDVNETVRSNMVSNVTSFLIGRKINTSSEKDKINLLKNIEDIFSQGYPVFNMTAIPGFGKFFNYIKQAENRKMDKLISEFIHFIRNEIDNHRSATEGIFDVEDFINAYDQKIQSRSLQQEQHYFTDTNLIGNISAFFIGGSDTTSTSINCILLMMAKYPIVQRKVHDELDEIGKDQNLNYADRYRVPYTYSVIFETLRFRPINAMPIPRVVREDMNYKGYIFPKGSVIVTNIISMHNDTSYWKNPELFQPERFICDGKVIENHPSFAPFIYGKRKCPGSTIALSTIFSYFIKIMQVFEISAPPGVEVNLKGFGGFIDHPLPQKLCFRKRT